MAIIGTAQAQVSVTATAGVMVATPYTSLKLAFDSINIGKHQGDITISILGNTTETATAVLNSSFSPSSYTSVLIKPVGGARTISGTIAGAIIKLNGADNVTIDGFQTAGPARDLTITNTNTTPSTSAAIWVASASSTDGASSIIIQNCNVNGSGPTTSIGAIVQSSGTTIGATAETENSGNSYINNLVTSALYGISLVGSSTLNDTDNNITGNSVGSVTPTQKLGHAGIFVAQQTDVTVSGNTVFGVTSTAGNFTFQTSGIYVGGTITGGLIEKNKISDIKIASVWGCNGIQLNSSTTSTNMTIANNFIWDIAAGGFTTSNSVDDNGFGIAVNTGGGYRIYYNSIDLFTNQGSGITAAFWVSGISSVNTLNVRNNIFSNRQTVGTRYAIYSNLPNTVFTAIDYNDYSSNQSVGFLGSARANLVAWQTATAQDVNSVAVNPQFTSTTNLHLLGNSPLEALAIPIAGITQDIDNDVRNVTTPDIGADEFIPPNCSTILPTTAGTASVSRTEICVSGSAVLSSTGYSYGIGTVYQWESAPISMTPWTALAGETNPLNGNTGVINSSRCYRLRVTCNAGAPVYSNVVCITVNSPTASGTGATRCGVGTVNLTSPGTNIKWYDVPTGGTFIGQGSPFTTPVISATTTYYVTTTAGGTTINGGKPSTNGADGTFTNGGIFFTANETFTLNSVVMYPTGAGTNTIDLFAGSTTTGTPIYTAFATFTGSNPSGVTVPIGWNIPPGSYTIHQSVQQAPCWRDYSASAVPPIAFPYNIGTAVTLTQGTLTNFYYFFYNWNITTGCESARVPVTATVTPPPGVTIGANPGTTICLGDSTILTATSGNGGYVYSWTPGTLNGPGPHTVFPTETTIYTVIANDGTCRNDVNITVTVNNAPAPMSITPTSASVCPDNAAPFVTTPLTVTGGTIVGQTIFNENAEAWPLTKFAIDPAGTGVTVQQNTTYYHLGLKSIHLKHSNDALGQLSKTTPNINLSTYSNPELTFWHIAALEGTVANPYDIGYVDYSLDGGVTYTNFPASAYGGGGTLHGTGVGFNQSSYSDWDAQFASSASTPGAGPATALWKKETISLATWQTNTQFRIRFRIDADFSVIYYGWLIDDIYVTGTTTPITWSPVTNLWANAAGTVPYAAGTFASTVYFNATVNTPATTYTASVAAGTCSESVSTTITATSIAASATITASPGTTICAGSSVTFTANLVNGGGTPGYQWWLDPVGAAPAVQISPAGFNPGLSPYTINGLNNGDAVYVKVLSSAGGCLPVNPVQSNTITLTVNPTPNVTITGGTTVCTGAPTALTANATIALPGTITGYQWYVDGNLISGATLSTYNATAPGGSYTVVAISNQGCRDTSAPHVVTQPTFTITATAGANGTISPAGAIAVPCGSNITFTITPNPSYLILDVLVDGITNPIAIASGSYTFTNVSATHTIHATFYIFGCSNPANATTGGNDTVCANNSHPLVGSVTGGSTTGTWSSLGDGTFSPTANYPGATSYTPGPLDILAGSTVITLTSGVPTLPCLISTSSYILTIKPAAAVSIVGQAGVCTVGATTIWLVADTSATSQPITGFQWYNGATPIAGQTNDSLLVSATGTYIVAAFSANGCTARDTLGVSLYAQPTVTASGGPTICTGAETELTAVGVPVNGTIPPNGYQWYRGAIAIAGATSATYLASTAGSYTVRVTNSNGCRSNFSTPAIVLTIDNSPLNGNYTIGAGPASCTNYVSFAAAIFDLNARTISGNVRFDVQPGHVEGAPNGGLALGSAALNPTTAGRTIQFLKNGAGANPLINAYTGGTGTPATAAPDGIWSLRGVDNVTISEVDLVENPSNITVPNMMEYGFGIFKLSASDGAQNNIIQNCNITLNKANSTAGVAPMTDGSNGIAVVNSTAIAATTALTPSAASGTNSNNKFYNNIITNCHVGIGLSGHPAPGPSPFTLADVGNDVGGSAILTGNNISNFGSAADLTAPVGIRIVNQWGINASYNTIRNNNGSGVNTNNDLRGIRTEQSVSAAATIIGNTITLTSGATGGQQTVGIDNGMGSTAASNTILISNNTITASASTVTTGLMTGINNTSTAATITIANNTIQSCTLPGTGTFAGIFNSVIVPTLNINNNTIENNTKTGTVTMTLIGVGSPTNATVNNNVLTGNVLTGGAVSSTLNCVTGGTSNYVFNGNTIDNNSISGMSGAAVGTIYGYYNNSSPLLETITNNNIRRLFINGPGVSTGLHLIRAIYNNTSASAARTVAGNNIDSLYSKSTFSTAISGIFTQLGANVSINRNKIHSLFPGQSGTVGAFAKGIQINGGTGVKVFNNMISLNLAQAFAPAANGVLTAANAVAGIDVSAGSATANIYFNTISLSGAGAGTFGSSGISLSVTSATADIRNNIVSNFMTGGSGLRVALRRTSPAFGGYSATSNNNLWYTTETATTPLYHDGSVSYVTLALFKANVTPRETLSIDDLPVFRSIPLNDLHIDSANACALDGAGATIAGYTTDYDADIRSNPPDLGADEFNGSGGSPTWKGVDTNWENPNNWCGVVPTITTDVIIPAGASNYPIIITSTPVARNITINVGGSITLDPIGTLSTKGSWTNNGTLTNNGTIVLNGTVNQVFPGTGTGTLATMTNLTVNNPGGATINKGLTILGTLKPKSGNISIADTVVLHSDASGTARVDTVQGTISYTGVGKFRVERYISSILKVAWRFLSTPITLTVPQTINQAWQESQATGDSISTGYGTQIIGPLAAGAGFDINTTLPSVKKYNPATNTWVTIPGTTGPISTTDGYMAFIRGDRDANVFGEQSATTLRMAGQIKTGNIGPLSTPNPSTFISVGNPYPSAISFPATTRVGLQDVYYLWDPQLNSYGGYRTFAGPGYVASPAGGSYAGGNKFIESGQAFFVISTAGAAPHNISMTENSKVGGSNQVARQNELGKNLQTNLFLVTGATTSLYDGVRVDFDPAYSNVVDDNDAPKLNNFGENFGLLREGKTISVERRAEIVHTDTLFFEFGQLRQQQYQLEFTPEHLATPGLSAFLEDAYLNIASVVSLEGVTAINFTVNADAGSYASNRFRLVFKQLGPVPVTFTSVWAYKLKKDIVVGWRVENETNIDHYEIEKSIDGINFTQKGTQRPTANSNSSKQYSWPDNDALNGNNFYRIISVDYNGTSRQSEIVKVNIKGEGLFTVYPNPVNEDGIINVRMENQPKAVYNVNILNPAGQVILRREVNHEGGSYVYSIGLNKIGAHGNYTLQIAEGDKVKTIFKIVY